MRYISCLLMSSALAVPALLSPEARAQSVRCAQEHLVAEFALQDGPASHRLLAGGALAVLHNDDSEIRIYEMSPAGEPLLRSVYPLYNTSARTTLHANGDDIYVTLPQSGQPDTLYDLLIIDAQNPEKPTLRTVFSVFYNFDFAEFVADIAYFMNNASYDAGNSVYHAYDIANPDNPALLHRVNMGVRVDNDRGMQIGGGLMHLSAANRLMTYAVDGLGGLQWLHTINFGADRVRSMEARDEHLFLYHAGGSQQPSFEAYDFSTPASPVLLSQTDVPAITQLRIEGQYAYLVGEEITAFNIVDPAAPVETATFNDFASISGFLADDERLYVIRSDEVTVFDSQIRNLGQPTQIHTPTAGQPREMAIEGDLAYLASGSQGVEIYDLSDPQAPMFIGSVTTTTALSQTTHVAATGAVLAAVNADAVELYSLKNPAAPAQRFTIDGLSYIADLAISGDTLAVMAHEKDQPSPYYAMWLYDISDPAAPSLLSRTPSFQTPGWLDIHGDMVFVYDSSIPVGGQHSGLTSFDISDPSDPEFSDMLIRAYVGRAAAQGDYLYVCSHYDNNNDHQDAVLVFDITDPHNSVLVGEASTGRSPQNIAVDGDRLIVQTRNGLFL